MLCNVKNVPAIAALTFLVISLATAIPVVGLLNALAMTAGAGAYGLMAATISISTRCPIIERLFGPRDKAYGTHKKLGMASAGLLIAHLGLTLATHDVSPLCAAGGSRFRAERETAVPPFSGGARPCLGGRVHDSVDVLSGGRRRRPRQGHSLVRLWTRRGSSPPPGLVMTPTISMRSPTVGAENVMQKGHPCRTTNSSAS